MNRQTLEGLVKTARMPWKPLVESGVDTRGISVKPLRTEPATGRAQSFVLRFEAGAKYPYHNHPAGEELFVLSGSCVCEDWDDSYVDFGVRSMRRRWDSVERALKSARARADQAHPAGAARPRSGV